MTLNYPGPYELRIAYTPDTLAATTLQHMQRVNVKLVEPAAQGQAFSAYNFEDINGVVTQTLDTLVEDWLTAIMAAFNDGTTVDSVELWKYPTAQSFDSIFWATYQPTANAGTSVSSGQAGNQSIFTFRSQEGGTMKVSLMEPVDAMAPPVAYAALSAVNKAIVDFVLGGDGVNYSAPFLARDTSYPFAFNRLFVGQNESTFKKRNRP